MGEIKVLSRTQRIIVESPSSVSIVRAGPIGPRGFPGENGSSGAGFEYEFEISDFVDGVLPVPHNLGIKPGGVFVKDSAGSIWKFGIVYNSNMLFTLDFGGLIFSGTVYAS